MATYAGYSLTYPYKKHWQRSPSRSMLVARSQCGKTLPKWAFARTIPEITCKVCRKGATR